MNTFILRGSFTGNMTDEEFLQFCLDNPELRIERNRNLEIVVMSPAGSLSGIFSGEVYGQLRDWNRVTQTGYVFDSSAGFTLPDRSVLSPDASWVLKDRWLALSKEQRRGFAPVCPEFVIEVRSPSDLLSDLSNKMKLWMQNGARLGWLIDPFDETVYIYRPDGSEQVIEGFRPGMIKGEGPVEGFVLDTSPLHE